MDSLRGIPVEHKLETFSMPSTGTTSGHPKNLLCRSERHSALDTKLHGDFEYFPHTSNNTLPSQHLAKPFRLKHPTSLNTTSLAAPRTNQIFKAANKVLSFVCVLLKNSFYLFRNSKSAIRDHQFIAVR